MRWAFPGTLYDAGMHTRRRLAALLAALALGGGLAVGCAKSGGPLPDGAPLLKESAETTKNLKSAHLVLRVTGDGLQQKLKAKSLEADLTANPSSSQGHGTVIYEGMDAEGDFVVIGDKLYAKLAGGQGWWTLDAANVYDVAAILDPARGLANVLSNFHDAKAVGRETIGGVTTIKVTGDVSLDAVNKIIPKVGANKPVPGTAWIREDGDHALVQAKLEPGNGSIQMTLSKWNTPITITQPAGT